MTRKEIDAIKLFKFALTKGQRKVAFQSYKTKDSCHGDLLRVVAGSMDKINEFTGQENDSRYMAYLLEYVFDQIGEF